MQPLVPASRRASQQRLDRGTDRELRESAVVGGASPQHPYAAPNAQNGYRNTQYERTSALQPTPNGNGYTANSSPAMPPTSDYQYGVPASASRQSGFGANGDASRPHTMNGNKGINVYDNPPRSRGFEQDEHGDRQKRGFFAMLCCRT